MGILSAIVTLPLAPVRGVVALAEVIQRQVEQEMRNPANTRRQLEVLEEARERGEISPEDEQAVQEQILESRVAPSAPTAPPPETG
ncbi:gas vesicle protein GvpG [Mycobacterium sp. NAZ190054]|uniref:gas vesicle protein GvpG n=1 Tax=Mycobacterium sp. NAZ190054 TaxID=1747766 RepID=UPI0007969159|nr:gas vesicle protein GvpG [Mycobacterium sp. NAZ190054]KWX62484.1 gas vesicle protein G [Mycobacterium sp. NAZ190054]